MQVPDTDDVRSLPRDTASVSEAMPADFLTWYGLSQYPLWYKRLETG